MVRVVDYIATKLASVGIKNVYGLMGGGASGLNDGFIRNPDLHYICTHHEQGAGYAAIGESKITKKITVVNPTTGCGGTNCVTPLLGAWQDSVPVLFISGNVKSTQTTYVLNKNKGISLRKYGIQEHNILDTVQSLTKYSAFIDNVKLVPFCLDKAIHEAQTPRMGPCWLDIPSDIQHSVITVDSTYPVFTPNNLNKDNPKQQLAHVVSLLSKFNRPLVLAGYGITLSNSNSEFTSFIENYNIPVVSTYMGADILGYNHPLYIGTIGIKGSRAGNFAIQNCDLLIILGSSLNCSHTGYDEKLFSPNSYKIMVDIDCNEFKKDTIQINEFINLDLKQFFYDQDLVD